MIYSSSDLWQKKNHFNSSLIYSKSRGQRSSCDLQCLLFLHVWHDAVNGLTGDAESRVCECPSVSSRGPCFTEGNDITQAAWTQCSRQMSVQSRSREEEEPVCVSVNTLLCPVSSLHQCEPCGCYCEVVQTPHQQEDGRHSFIWALIWRNRLSGSVAAGQTHEEFLNVSSHWLLIVCVLLCEWFIKASETLRIHSICEGKLQTDGQIMWINAIRGEIN